MPSLYVVASPIGNLEDVTLRALRVLREVPLIAAEDTRTARVLLDHFGIAGKRLVSYTEHNRARRIPELLAHLAEADLALVCDAGTPGINDPGVELADAAQAAGYAVVAVPGASAVVAALSIAGLPTHTFSFVGFLPRTDPERRRLFAAYAERPETLVALETPQRLRDSLAVLAEALPARRVAVCRELTKLHEEVFRGSAAEALAHFAAPRGEVVLLIEGAGAPAAPPDDADALAAEVVEMRVLGLTRSQATALLTSRHGLNRRRAYQLWLAAEREG